MATIEQHILDTSGLYYKHMTIVNDDSRVIIKWSSELIDTARGVIYDHHMFIVQATVQETTVLSYHRSQINTDVEKMNYI
jgi:hypothetical protein